VSFTDIGLIAGDLVGKWLIVGGNAYLITSHAVAASITILIPDGATAPQINDTLTVAEL
jgi:hypothetical protein